MKLDTIVFNGEIKEGKLTLENKKSFLKYLLTLTGKIQLSVERRKRKRTFNQNSWYWGVVLPIICETTGYTLNEQDRIFEQLFAPKKIIKFKGRDLVIYKHCREMTTGEFVEFIERIRACVADMGVIIPDPDFNYQII